MVIFRVYDKELGTENIIRKGNTFLLNYPCSKESGDECTPYVGQFSKGRYKFELWGAGNIEFKNGGYSSGIITLEKEETFYLFVGGHETFFNSAKGNVINGTKGNGASDVRLTYEGVWHNFDSLKSRIIVAGAGGNQYNYEIGEKYGVGTVCGNYGYAGGLKGYEGEYGYNSSYEYAIVYPGEPGQQTKGGKGGLSTQCNDYGENGSFGIGGISGSGCKGGTVADDQYSYHGSGGYYGSGGSGGHYYQYWHSHGTAGGSSFISGHRGCDAITENSTESKIIHTHYPYHYSNFVFSETMMIDGSGRIWENETAGDFTKMPNPKGNFLSLKKGNGGNGFIRITILAASTCFRIRFCRVHLFKVYIFTVIAS
jgi:hypothetical protein